MNKTCEQCGKEFLAKRTSAKFCRPRCNAAACKARYHQRHPEKDKEYSKAYYAKNAEKELAAQEVTPEKIKERFGEAFDLEWAP